MYDPIETLAAIDDHKWQILALCGLAMACNYAWFFAAFRQAKRDQVYAIPLFCSFFWLVGDATVVINFDRAFNDYDHWYLKLFWVALVITVLFELTYLRQAMRYGRAELLPSWSPARFAGLLVAGVCVSAAVWATIQTSIQDDLFIVYFHIANVAMPVFYAGVLLRRRSTAGTNRFIWIAYIAMESCWYLATFLWFGDDLRNVETVALWAITTAGCLGILWTLGRLPEGGGEGRSPAPVPPVARTEPVATTA